MKTRSTLLLLALFTSVALRAAFGDELEFTGVMIDGTRTRIGLVDSSTGTAGWVRVGGSFLGYTVSAYDPVKETVTLTRDDRPPLAIRLKDAILLLSPPPSPWAQPSNAQRAAVAENLRQLAAAAAQFYSETGADAATLGDLVGPGKPLEQLESVAGESYTNIVMRRDTPGVAVTTPDGTRISSDGTSTAADGSTITPDGGRIAADGTAYAPDGTLLTGNTVGSASGPYIPPTASTTTARALLAAGWRYRPQTP